MDAVHGSPKPQVVVLVGHCGFDSGGLTRLVQAAVPDAQVVGVHADRELGPYLRSGNLLLVNRVLDGRFAAGSGVELIEQIGKTGVAAMLVSNFPEAQAAAVAAGARPGFGKSDMHLPAVRERIAAALASAS